MRPRPTSLLLAVLLTVSGIAAAQEPPTSPPSQLAGFTVSCSGGAPSLVAGCFLEAPGITLGPLLLSLGVDAQVDLDQLYARDLAGAHLTPYLVGVYAIEHGAVWGELALPADLLGIPVVGRADWLRVGFSYTVPP